MAEKEPKSERDAKGEGSISAWQGKYKGYITVDGKRKYFYGKTKAEAAQKRRALLTERENGTIVLGKAMTVGEWLDHWMVVKSKLKKSTRVGYATAIRLYLKPELGSIPLDKLTIERVEKLYADLAARGLKGNTIHQPHAILRNAMKMAVQRGKVGRNVVEFVDPPSIGKADTKSFSEAEVDRILDAAVGHRYEALYHLRLQYGLRPSESLGVQWPFLDTETGRLRVAEQLQQIAGEGAVIVPNPKTAAGDRKITLAPYLLDMLATWRMTQLAEMAEAGDQWKPFEWEGEPRAFVFTQKNGQPLRPGLDATLWRALLEKAMVPHSRIYTGRHTAASTLLGDGVDIATVAATLGHSDPSFTMKTYVHAVDERVDALADHIEQRRARAAAKTPVPVPEPR